MNVIIVDPDRESCKIYTDEWMSILKKKEDMEIGTFINGCCNIIRGIAEKNQCKVLVDKHGTGLAYFDCLKKEMLDVDELKFARLV